MTTKHPPVRLDYPFHGGSERARDEALSRVTVIATQPPARRGVLTELGFWLLLSVAFCVAAVVLAATYLVGSR